MPKPPTSQRGRQARVAVVEPPAPSKRPWLRRFVAGQAAGAVALDPRGTLAPPPRRSAASRRASSASLEPGVLVSGSDFDELDAADGLLEDGPAARLGLSWRAIVSLLLCLVGLGVSIYLTIGHYANYQLACPRNSTFDCEAVTHSPQSVVFGIPVAVLGLVYFVPMLALCSPWAWRSANRLVAPCRLAGVVSGVGFVFYLIYNELFVIGKICIWCSSVHLITLVLFVVVATGWDEATEPSRLAAEDDDGGDPAYA